jgi:hypothetical protein
MKAWKVVALFYVAIAIAMFGGTSWGAVDFRGVRSTVVHNGSSCIGSRCHIIGLCPNAVRAPIPFFRCPLSGSSSRITVGRHHGL